MYIYIYIYIYIHTYIAPQSGSESLLRRGDDKIGSPHRAQISQFEPFDMILLKLDKQFAVEQFEATASQSTAPSPPPLTFQ